MEIEAAKLLGAGLAVLGVNGAALGVGRVFASMIDAVARNPSAEKQMTKFAYMGAAFSEALGIFSLLIAFIVLFR